MPFFLYLLNQIEKLNEMKVSFIAFILAALLSFQAFCQQPQTPPLTVEKISENLYQLVGGRGANGGFYIGKNEVMVIDSKMDKESVEAIFTAIKGFTATSDRRAGPVPAGRDQGRPHPLRGHRGSGRGRPSGGECRASRRARVRRRLGDRTDARPERRSLGPDPDGCGLRDAQARRVGDTLQGGRVQGRI